MFFVPFSFCVMSHPSPNEWESLVQEAEEVSGAGYEAMLGGAAAPAGRPAQDQPRAKRTKCAFAGDVDVPQAASESYEGWSLWRDHVSATFRAFLSDDMAAKKAGEYHVELMHRGLDQASVDVATAWAAPSVEPHEALLMVGLYESHARWKLDVVAGKWRHMNPPAQAPPQGGAPRGQDPQASDRVRAEIGVLEARLAQLRGPSVPQLSLGELQRVANAQLHYAWQRYLVETLVIFLRSDAPQQGYDQSQVATTLSDGTWATLWRTLGIKEGELPPRRPLRGAPLGPASSAGCTASGRANATCSSPSPLSSRSRNGSRSWRSRRPRVGARQKGSLCTGIRPCTRRSVPGARMTRADPPPLPVREVQRHAPVVPPLPYWGAAAPPAAAGPSGGPPAPPPSPFAEGGEPPSPPGDLPPLGNSGRGGGGGGWGQGHSGRTPWPCNTGLWPVGCGFRN